MWCIAVLCDELQGYVVHCMLYGVLHNYVVHYKYMWCIAWLCGSLHGHVVHCRAICGAFQGYAVTAIN